jgi:hypothetical protein
MGRIGGGGSPPGNKGVADVSAKPADLTTKEGKQEFRSTVGTDVPKRVVDSFEKAGVNIEKKLTSMGAKLRFTNEDLAQLARLFSGVLMKNPNADRKKRAKLFAKTIIKNRRFGRIFDDLDEEDQERLEDMYEMIAEQLDSSPRLAQLVEEVTEGARKFTI